MPMKKTGINASKHLYLLLNQIGRIRITTKWPTRYTPKELPQPQEDCALGFDISNPDPLIDSI